MSVKILFIDPPGTVPGVNTGLGYLAAALKKSGHEVRVLDFNNYPEHQEGRLITELKSGYDVIGFSVKFNTIRDSVRLAGLAKKHSSGCTLVAGGPGVTVEGCGFLGEYPVFDYAFRGESENSFVEFSAFLEEKRTLEEIPGICYKNNGKIDSTASFLIEDIESIPFPDYSDFDFFNMQKYNYPMVTSRGCPYNCSYCSVRLISGRKFRARTASHVVEELAQAKERYNIKQFEIVDDTFTQDVERAKDICRELIRRDLRLSWLCPNGIRADRTDEELFQLMWQSGCREVWIGVESLNEEVFELIKKGEKIEDIVRALKNAKKANLRIGAFFIIGLPNSTYEKDLETLRKAMNLGLDICTWSIATPMPQTTLKEWVEIHGKLLDDYKNVSFFVEPKCVFETEDYPESIRLRMFYKGNLSFYRYDTLTGEHQPLKKLLRILLLIFKFDPWRLPLHLLKGSRYFAWLVLRYLFS